MERVFASAKSRTNVCVSSEKRRRVWRDLCLLRAQGMCAPCADGRKSGQHHPRRDSDGVAHHWHEEVTPTWRRSPADPRGTQEAPQRSPRSGVGPWHRWEGRGRARTHLLRLWRRPRGRPRATADSSANPRLPRTPALEQLAR